MKGEERGEWAHPYVPKDMELPGYVPCFLSQMDIVVPYLGTSVLLVSLVWLLSGTWSFVCVIPSARLPVTNLME